RDLVSLTQEAERDESVHVVVFSSADPDYFISHVAVNQIADWLALLQLLGELAERSRIGDNACTVHPHPRARRRKVESRCLLESPPASSSCRLPSPNPPRQS